MTLLAALIGVGLAGGVVVFLSGVRPTVPPTAPARRNHVSELLRSAGLAGPRASRRRIQLAAGIGGGVLGFALTGWILLVIAIPIAALGLPILLTKKSPGVAVEDIAALETWTRSLAGILRASAGLETAVIASLASAPERLRPSVSHLVARLNSQQPFEGAVRAWADELNDSASDMVATVLISGHRTGGVGTATALIQLCNYLADTAKARRAIETEQASPRTSARTVTLITLAILAVMPFMGSLTAAYRTPLGQIVLAVILTAYAALLIWMHKIAAGKPIPRFLPPTRRPNA